MTGGACRQWPTPGSPGGGRAAWCEGDPMAPLHERAALLPRLTADNYRITSPASPRYNCIAWAAGRTDAWWWPTAGWEWPSDAPREVSLPAFLAAFVTLG